jgi:hypothetical protein
VGGEARTGKEPEPDWRVHTPTRETACGRVPWNSPGSPGWLGWTGWIRWIGWIGWAAQSGAMLRMVKLGSQGLEPGCPSQTARAGKYQPGRLRRAGKQRHRVSMSKPTVHASDACRGTYHPRQAGRGMARVCNTPSMQSSLVVPGQYLDCEGGAGDPCPSAPRTSLIHLRFTERRAPGYLGMRAAAGNCRPLDSNWRQSQAALASGRTQALVEDPTAWFWALA